MGQTQDQNAEDIQRRILQNTLDEVAAREEDATDCCVICLDIITEPCEALPCGHRNFDYICVSNWLFGTPQCPLCKAKVIKVVHGPSDDLITTFFNQTPSTASSSTATTSRPGGSINFGRRGRYRVRGQRSAWPRNDARSTAVSNVVAARRDVYRHQRYSKHVGSNRLSRYRELTPQMFCTDTELVSRARMWIRRELRVFSFLTPDEDEGDEISSRPTPSSPKTAVQHRRANNAEFLLEYIIAILKSVDIMGSGGQAEDMLSDFLGRENTKLFLHELRAWLRSPFTKLEDWDRAVQYETDTERAGRRGDVPRVDGRAEDRTERERGETNRQGFRQKGDFYRPRGRRDMRHGVDRSRDGERRRRRSASPRHV
ncbi:zinc finger domain-containing protein [Pochonia chlamydosporia 170]|uniref:RING-type E3 ubiquitin transferase n=1 Tax=Pochonia chlamydosporia 170 TaxID=1380566 RepID=A0A179FLG7_METCM|nr:zinc finger domain-containing protein [Pochonia chlamydosporia 170]OAQ66188.1 zinc finger domain-containing protein [Pochonia chlamydosporia 170]